MKKYHFNILINDFKTNAGSKAVNDCKRLLLERSYIDIDISFRKHPLLLVFNLCKLMYGLASRYFNIQAGSLIIVQYPLKGINQYFRQFIRLMKLKGCYFIAIVHDLDSLRYKKPEYAVRDEIKGLNAYDVVISHNNKMTGWLRAKGLKTQVENLQIFDYLFDQDSSENRADLFASGNKEVVFAGSLGRGKFIFCLKELLTKLPFRLYGPGLSTDVAENNNQISWEGSFPADELVRKLKGNFGLIWDGDSLHSCEGPVGDYIAFNNPHKLSLYLAARLPVIIPAKAALAEWIISQDLGIAVESLFELDEKMASISPEHYKVMIQRASEISSKLKEGYYFRSALSSAEEYIGRLSAGVSREVNDKAYVDEKDIS